MNAVSPLLRGLVQQLDEADEYISVIAGPPPLEEADRWIRVRDLTRDSQATARTWVLDPERMWMRRHPEGWFDGFAICDVPDHPVRRTRRPRGPEGNLLPLVQGARGGRGRDGGRRGRKTDGTHYCLSCPLPDETLRLPKWRQWLEAEHLHLNPDSVTETSEHVVMACRGTSYGAPALEVSAGSGCTPSLTEGQATRRRFLLVRCSGRHRRPLRLRPRADRR